MKGRSIFLIAFAQRPAKSRLYGSFKYGKSIKTTYRQGMGWIDSENYQIICLNSDLLTPLPEIGLRKSATEIVFSEVQFNRVAQKFWLPVEVTVTLDWNRHAGRKNPPPGAAEKRHNKLQGLAGPAGDRQPPARQEGYAIFNNANGDDARRVADGGQRPLADCDSVT